MRLVSIPADVEEYENGEVEEDSNDSRALIDEEELEDAEEENDSEDMWLALNKPKHFSRILKMQF